MKGRHGGFTALTMLMVGATVLEAGTNEAARDIIDGLMRVQLDSGVPVISAVLTPHHFHEHEVHRTFLGDHFVGTGSPQSFNLGRVADTDGDKETRVHLPGGENDTRNRPGIAPGTARTTVTTSGRAVSWSDGPSPSSMATCRCAVKNAAR